MDSVSSVKNGVKLVDEVAEKMKKVTQTVNETVVTTGSIEQATQHESVSLGQISMDINQVSGVVQTNSATSEESAAASDELAGQVNVLKTLVEGFNLRK